MRLLSDKYTSDAKYLDQQTVATPGVNFTPYSIEKLPMELIHHIMSFLNRRDHVEFALISKRFSEVQTFSKDLKAAKNILRAICAKLPIPIETRIKHIHLFDTVICNYLLAIYKLKLNQVLKMILHQKIALNSCWSPFLAQLIRYTPFSIKTYTKLPLSVKKLLPNYIELEAIYNLFESFQSSRNFSMNCLSPIIRAIIRTLNGETYREAYLESAHKTLSDCIYEGVQVGKIHINEVKESTFLSVMARIVSKSHSANTVASIFRYTSAYIHTERHGRKPVNTEIISNIERCIGERKANLEFMKLLVQTNPFLIDYFPVLQEDKTTCITAIREICELTYFKSSTDLNFDVPDSFLKWLPINLAENPHVVIPISKLIRSIPKLYHKLPDLLKDQKEIVKVCLKYYPKELANQLFCHRDDQELALIAVKQHGKALRYASSRLRNNKYIVLIAISNDPCAYQYASEELQLDEDVQQAAGFIR
ncbi:MAG: hypothetical protein K0S74_1115 [Chlamydiales bacterium]|jgi:hypothetical protein|nr:hypothetical protein [Chlamydiales bacterium]